MTIFTRGSMLLMCVLRVKTSVVPTVDPCRRPVKRRTASEERIKRLLNWIVTLMLDLAAIAIDSPFGIQKL